MPVTADSFLWEATNFGSGTSIVVTHPDAGGTTAGTTVLVTLAFTGSPVMTVPAGFARINTNVVVPVYAKSDVAAGETSWTFGTGSSMGWVSYLAELDNVALTDPGDGSAFGAGGSTVNGGTRSSGTATNAGSSGAALAFFCATKAGGSDVQSWSDYTNSFVERVDAAPAPGSTGRQIAVAWKPYDGWSTWETTATFATTAASATSAQAIVLLRSAEASINAPLAYFTGFGFATHAGMGNSATSPLGATAAAPAGTWGTNYSVGSIGRDGRTGLEVLASASIANVPLPTLTSLTLAFGANVQAVSGSGTPEAVRFDPYNAFLASYGSGPLSLLYDVTNAKFGLVLGGGSAVWQTGTTPLNTWAWVDIRMRMNSSVWHADWSIETGTGDGSQTSPADLTGLAASLDFKTWLGGTASQTGRFRYSDVVLSRYAGAYPLGPHVGRLLVPEATGATVSGTAANFQRFTNNGTLAAVNGTEGALLDEVPPTVSASSDGVVQVTTAASDYINVPMTTYTLAYDEIIAAVRFVASEWGGTGAGTGTLGWRGYDGLTETTFQAASALYDADSLTAISATYPRWVSAMWSGAASGAWTQTRLNDAAVRMGFSTDATPDMGASAVYLEVATRTITPVRLLTVGENDEFTADIVVNPYHSGTVSYIITNEHATDTAEFTYSISGTPQAPVTVTPAEVSKTVDIHAAAFGDISDAKLTKA